MKGIASSTVSRLALFLIVGTLAVGLGWPLAGTAQEKPADPGKHKHAGQPADTDKDLSAQLRELKAKVATLEAALEKRYPGTTGKGMAPGMGMMGSGGMGMMGGKGMGMMGMEMMGGKGMEMMGGMMKGMGGMETPSALPGFPGASHIYHVGATGFFLDHPEHIQLTTKQQVDLNGIKEKSLLEQATTQRKIDEAEQELWTLTASDEPDAAKIEAKVHAIEKLRADQRLAFIRSVGEAAKLLTDEQRQALLGTAKPQSHQHTPAPSR